MTPPMRPVAVVTDDLAEARAMAEATAGVTRDDPLVMSMLQANDREIERLQAELAEAQSSDIEISIVGRHVVGHQIEASYLARVVADLQAAYRAVAEMISPDERPKRSATRLMVAGTAPGSFRVLMRSAPEPLSLLEAPLSVRTLDELFTLTLNANSRDAVRLWAERATDTGVRGMIRFAATLAASQGTTQLRWTPIGEPDRLLTVSADHARLLAVELAGATGREILSVEGHLGMAQDDPPRVRISNATDEFVAAVSEELLEPVREMLFQQVVAELVVDMSTSPSTGAPTTRTELLSLSLLSDVVDDLSP